MSVVRTLYCSFILVLLGVMHLLANVVGSNGSDKTTTVAAREAPKPPPTPEDFAERGLRDAKQDLAKGEIVIRGSGLSPHYPDRWNPETMYKELLYERTGLRLANGGCAITPHSEAYNQAYNGEVKSWLTNKFGADVFSQARADSRKAYEAYRKGKDRRAKSQKEKPVAAGEYEIQPGDTFYAIAERYGCSVGSLMTANEGLDPRRLQVGQRIILPNRPTN